MPLNGELAKTKSLAAGTPKRDLRHFVTMLLNGGRGNDCRNSRYISIIQRDGEDNIAVNDAARPKSCAYSKAGVS